MKRYLLFYYETYYPNGGSSEVLCNSDSLDDFPEKMSEIEEQHQCRQSREMIYEVLDLQERVWLKVNYKWVDGKREVVYEENAQWLKSTR